jgi:Alpha-aminoadipate carrier protein LysW-like, globular domain
MAMAICPACDAEVEVDELDADVGDELSCPECGQSLVVNGTDPIELDFADDEDEEEDDDEDEAEEVEEDDADLDEEDEETEDGDWDE